MYERSGKLIANSINVRFYVVTLLCATVALALAFFLSSIAGRVPAGASGFQLIDEKCNSRIGGYDRERDFALSVGAATDDFSDLFIVHKSPKYMPSKSGAPSTDQDGNLSDAVNLGDFIDSAIQTRFGLKDKNHIARFKEYYSYGNTDTIVSMASNAFGKVAHNECGISVHFTTISDGIHILIKHGFPVRILEAAHTPESGWQGVVFVDGYLYPVDPIIKNLVLLFIVFELVASLLLCTAIGYTRIRRINGGLCHNCKYDVSAAPFRVCPECGYEIVAW